MGGNSTPPGNDRPVFRTKIAEAEFFAAYDAMLARWPVAVDSVDIPSAYGTTRVHVCGPRDGAPLVLLHGGGATATVWFANVAELSRAHRVYAVDQIGDAGRSIHNGRRIGGLPDLMAWLDAVFSGLGLSRAGLCGHSYGAWLALNYALHAPHAVDRLALLDPNQCFAGMKPGYLLRAVPLVTRPTAKRQRAFINWETDGAPLDPAWLTLVSLGAAEFPTTRVVIARRPEAGRVRSLRVPTLVLLAEKSKTHDIHRVARNVGGLLPDATIATLADVSHHAVPLAHPARLNCELLAFFD